MQISKVRTKLAKNEPVVAVKVAYQDPAIYEMVGQLGFDCIWICNEHVGIDPTKMDSFIRACRCSNIDAMVRIKPGSYQDLLQPLEMGAKGIMIPKIKDADEVRQVIEDMKFYPIGSRGADGVNADADFGLNPIKNYLEEANANTFLVVQIEDMEAAEHIEEIAQLEAVDVIFVGPGDLSISIGEAGNLEHPCIEAVCDRVAKACKTYHKAAGVACGTRKRLEHYYNKGFRFLTAGSDYVIIKTGLENLKEELNELSFL